ncbi:uncharacterized protein LOC130975783 [Arachis stenosperma]|uniref:uncharacterized protein LOC130975783 n=1 Tax=Arachis stenosperma TaxID=217475 RepID=UPI0025ACA5DD|nr:uncharacterized protein LOC130975783 [Arachis stenosperma]
MQMKLPEESADRTVEKKHRQNCQKEVQTELPQGSVDKTTTRKYRRNCHKEIQMELAEGSADETGRREHRQNYRKRTQMELPEENADEIVAIVPNNRKTTENMAKFRKTIEKSKKYGVKFTNREPLSIFISSSSTLSDLKNSILSKLGVFGSKWVNKLFYKIPITIVSTGVKYDTFVIAADEDIRVLFHCLRSFPEVRIHELYAKLEVGVDSYGASAPVLHSTTMGGDFSLMAAAEPTVSIRHQTYEVDNDSGIIPDVLGFGEPDRVENVIWDDDSDQEHVDIIGDSDDDTGANPYSMALQNKEEDVLSVKDYSIRRGIEYGVLESDHLKYHGKYKEFGKGCNWLIHISLRARKCTWEVRREDATVTIKVLQEATEANYGLRPSYRKVWMAKQKAITQIYGDREESYAELPRWMLGVQSTHVRNTIQSVHVNFVFYGSTAL